MNLNKLPLVIMSTVLALLVSTSAHALDLEFENQNPYYDNSTVNIMFYGSSITGTYNAGANNIELNRNYTFQELSGGVSVSNYIGGLMYVSMGNEMTNGRGVTQPAPNNPSDPDYSTRWNNVEITVTPSPFDVADITGINLFAIPMKLEAELGGAPQPDDVTYNVTGIQMRDDLGAITSNSAQAVLKDAAGNFLRVLGPTAYAAGEIGPYPSLQPYVDSIKTSGQQTTIKGTYSGNGASTPALTAQTYDFTATIESNGDIKLTGSGSVVGANQTIIVPNAQPTPHAGNIASQIYAADPGFYINGGTTIDSFGINDVYGAAVRDFLSGMAIGYVGSPVPDPSNGNVLFKDESSDKWFTQALAFSQVQPTNAYYNQYAAVFFQNSNVYGFPFSDHLNGEQVQVKIGPANADTLLIKVLTDGATAPMTFQQAQTNAIANAGSPAGFQPTSAMIITNQGGGGTPGLQYDTSGNVIVRAPVLSSTLSANYVGETGVTIAGAPTTGGERVTTGNDFTNFYDTQGGGTVNGMLIRTVERGMGLNKTGTHNAIVEYTVAPDNDTIQRLTKNPDITTYNPSQYGSAAGFVQPAGMGATAFSNFSTFYGNYGTAAYTLPFNAAVSRPFTQLGYTYYWQNGDQTNTLANITGMNEFVLLGGTDVNVYGIYSTPSYIYTKNPANSQYGNGYANFNVTGACNTLWAGHRFQQGVSYLSSTPNTIEMHMASSMSGGEGLLVWSLNYNVTNNGFIAGPTSNKFGIAGTNNIAILFKGDTTNTYGTPITQGINELSNRGTISSPGIAIKVENGDTTIDNTVITSLINGNTTAIDLAGGNNTITNYGKITSAGTALRLRGGTTTITNSAAATVTGSIIVDPNPTGVLDIGNSTFALGGSSTYTQGAGVTLKLLATRPDVYGNISAGSATLDATNTVNVKVGGNIGSGTRITVVNTSGAGVGALPGTITTSSPLYSFTGDIASGNLVLTAHRQRSFEGIAGSSNASAVGAALESMGTSAGGMAGVLDTLNSMSSTQAISDSIDTMHPNASYGNMQASYSITDQFMSKVSNRLGMARTGITEMGISTGDFFQGTGFWFQGLGSHAKQDERGGIQGFQYNTFGTMAGADKIISDHARIGVAGGYGYADVNSKTPGSPRDNINSFQGTIYGSFDTLSLGKSREEGKYSEEAVRTQGQNLWYVDGMFGFTQNNFDSKRNVLLGNNIMIAGADHYGQQYSPMVETGYTFVMPKVTKKLQMTPLASLQYSYLRMNGYSEEGAGALNLNVKGDGFNSMVQGLGMQFAYPLVTRKSGTFIPTVRGIWNHDYFGENFVSTSSFAGGGPSFETSSARPARDGFLFSSSMVFLNKGNMTLSANYDWEIKEQFQSYTYYGTVRFDF